MLIRKCIVKSSGSEGVSFGKFKQPLDIAINSDNKTLSKCDYLLLDHMLVRHEYVSEPMSQLRLQNLKGIVGFTLLPLKLLSYLQYGFQMA